MWDVYLSQECVFGPGYFSYCPRIKEERDQQLMIYCIIFLPSPVFNMERLMPTNREAQKKYLPYPLDEAKPEPTSMMSEDLKEEEMKMSKEAMKFREVKELEKDEAEDTMEKKKKMMSRLQKQKKERTATQPEELRTNRHEDRRSTSSPSKQK
ncbi:uncharacterized protein LOC143803886 [Ranitomeya variabilis]|uniref:uncharacterized protein LOC143803886 n=1 Tax=Ranitomeya variabilis TaxID=490064 RepID=UPI0040568822